MSHTQPEKSSPSRISRREALSGAAAAAATLTIVPRHVLGGPGETPPSEKPVLAGVGVGGVGFGQMKSCDEAGFHVAALCDVDEVYAAKAFDHWPQARRYRDFRDMLASEGDKIDAVYCGTPDHTHTIIALAALRAGKHVCCVKPLTRTIEECRLVTATAKQAGVATQVTASPNTSEKACRTCELIWAGAIGPVREVHVWSNRPLWPQGMNRPAGQDTVPSTFDWNLWIGPAPMRPFKDKWPEGSLVVEQINSAGSRNRRENDPVRGAVYHPWNFRGWWDFGTGSLGDMGCHYLNTPYRALKLVYPTSVSASSTRVFDESAPLASIVTYDFPARGEMPPARVVWYDGGLKPPVPAEMQGRTLPAEGTLYVGDEGKMLESKILDPERAAKFESVPKTLPRRAGTWGEWYEAVRGGEPAGCNFDWAGPLTEFVLLGNIAIRTGKCIEFDGATPQITNDKAANAMLREEYHNGWSLHV
ncbi:MAG: Gfo/Idh/MocA family protein [Planctomycetota bacterium]